MAEEGNLFDDPEYKIFSRFDKIRDLNIRKASHIEQLERVRFSFFFTTHEAFLFGRHWNPVKLRTNSNNVFFWTVTKKRRDIRAYVSKFDRTTRRKFLFVLKGSEVFSNSRDNPVSGTDQPGILLASKVSVHPWARCRQNQPPDGAAAKPVREARISGLSRSGLEEPATFAARVSFETYSSPGNFPFQAAYGANSLSIN